MKTLCAAVVMLASAVWAQAPRNAVERARDRQDLRQDRRQLADDRKDATEAGQLLADYDRAAGAGNTAKLAQLDAVALRRVDAELAESRVESGQARQEIREDTREVRGDRRELAKDVATGRRPGVTADDARDLARDKANRADDVADAARERLSRERLEAIRAQLTGLSGRYDAGSVAQKRALYAEVLGEALKEIGRDKEERAEDRRELREDRRETREDRRQRR